MIRFLAPKQQQELRYINTPYAEPRHPSPYYVLVD